MQPTLLVLAAGMGSRYGGVKQIDAVGKHGECLLDYATFDAKRSGFGKVVFIIRKDIEADFRERLFDRIARNCNAEYVFQTPTSLLTELEQKSVLPERTKPWGTVHAVLCAEKVISEPFAVINSDDYYGRDAFATLGTYLSRLGEKSAEHAMVGYVLKNTMSRNGTVSRGVCAVKDGFLESIAEHTNIGYRGSDIVSDYGGKEIHFTGDEWVSMNLFGFGTTAFEEFHVYWENFKKTSLSSLKDEALLPVAASDIVAHGTGKIRVFTSTERWFGMTYPQDRIIVQDEIGEKIRTGYYPEKLWEK